jgi:hypothetical protein
MPLLEPELASPLTLLEESKPVAEALFLSYGAQLGFFERIGLAAARGLGARVSVIADASRVSIDVAAVRRAGLRYLDGRVDVPGRAFHPKLVVLAGPKGTTLAIGSANLTLGGWHGNAEIWSVLRASPERSPGAVASVADFLTALPRVVTVGPGVEQALSKCAEQLNSLADSSDSGPTLVHSLTEPILEQLPAGPVDELHLHAPFFDRGLLALAALCDQLKPKDLTVYIHTETSVDGPSLQTFLEKRGGRWRAVKDVNRYHHGKLIEWVSDGRRFALTGSPNLSTPALLKSVVGGGNVELGLITEIADSLAPETTAEPARPLAEHRIETGEPPAPSVLVLGAVMGADGVQVILGRPLEHEAKVEIQRDGDWSSVGSIASGLAEAVVLTAQGSRLGGTALRLRSPEGEPSNIVFIADLDAVRQPQIERTGTTQTTPMEIFSDYSVARAFAEDLARLRRAISGTASGVNEGGDGGGGNVPAGPSVEKQTAEEYLERCDAGVGAAMTRFGLGLPVLPGSGGRIQQAGRTGDEPDPDSDEDEVKRRVQDLSGAARRRYKKWFERLFDLVPELPVGGLLIVINLTVIAAADGLWDVPRDWLDPYAATVCSLFEIDPDSEVDEEAREAAAVLALMILEAHIERRAGSDPARDGFERVARRLKGRLSGRLDVGVFELGAADVLAGFGRSLHPGDTAEMLERVAHPPSVLDRAVTALAADFAISAGIENGELVLDGIERTQRTPVLIALACTESDGRVAARITTETGGIKAVWERPDLLVLRDTPRGQIGELFRLPNGLRIPPTDEPSYPLPKVSCSWMPGQDPPEAARHLL